MTEQKAPPPPSDEETLELVDERQILAELQGMHFEDDKYIFPVRGGSAGFQLTYRAIKLACRKFEERGEVLEVTSLTSKYDDKDPEYIVVHAHVQRVKVTKEGLRIPMGSEVGVKRKWVKEALRDGTIRLDPSFYEKACAQAQRNAKMALLPQDFLLEFKDMLLKKGAQKGGQAARPAQQQQQKPQGGAKPAEKKPDAAPAAGAPPKDAAAPPANAPQGEKPKDPEKRKLTLQQQFWATFKTAIPQADTEPKQRKVLQRLTGKTHVRELEESVIKTLGAALRKVSEGESAIKELEDEKGVKTLAIYHAVTTSFHWPIGFKPKASPPAQAAKPAEQKAAAPAAPPAEAPAGDPEAPPPADEEPLF